MVVKAGMGGGMEKVEAANWNGLGLYEEFPKDESAGVGYDAVCLVFAGRVLGPRTLVKLLLTSHVGFRSSGAGGAG